jgi:hypothetical protein
MGAIGPGVLSQELLCTSECADICLAAIAKLGLHGPTPWAGLPDLPHRMGRQTVHSRDV